MGDKSDLARVRHMLDYARQAEAYAGGTTRRELSNDVPGQSLLILSLQTIGEAANRTSEAFRLHYPEVPWRQIIAMRHRLIHAYHEINMDVIWETSTAWLPALIKQLESVLEQEAKNGVE